MNASLGTLKKNRKSTAAPLSPRRVVCVDLDGTLLLQETHLSILISFARQSLPNIFRALLWACTQGPASTKRRITQEVNLKALMKKWTFNRRLLDQLTQERRQGSALALVTGAPPEVASLIAGQLGFFDYVLSSDATCNLVGAEKARHLVRLFGEKKFVYVGNSTKDIAVWRHAAEVWTARLSWAAALQLAFWQRLGKIPRVSKRF